MVKVLAPFLVWLFFAGCSQITPYNPHTQAKAFEQEDFYIFSALEAEEQKRYAEAAEIYSELFERSDKSEYLYRALAMYNGIGAFDKVLAYSRAEQKKHPEDKNLIRFEVIAMLALKQYGPAKEKVLKLVAEGKEMEDLLLASEVYIKTRRYDTALKYLERAYAINYDEEILDKMSIILYVNLGRKSEAISHLESHSRLHGCSALICKRLAGYYSEENNVDGMLSTYLRLYDVEPQDEYAQAVIKLYSYKKEYPQLLDFLEKSGADDITMLQLYINAKSYVKAAALSKKLYEARGDAVFLGQHAIFTYESAENKQDKTMLAGVVANLEKVIKIHPESLYLNYLGYLLIDHDLDLEMGMEYVRQALKQDPESPFYNDSLAWGYYKLGKCEKAKKLMDSVIAKLGKEDKEVAGHLEAIEKCLKRQKKKTVK